MIQHRITTELQIILKRWERGVVVHYLCKLLYYNDFSFKDWAVKLFLMRNTSNIFSKLQRIKKYKLQGMKYTKKYKIENKLQRTQCIFCT